MLSGQEFGREAKVNPMHIQLFLGELVCCLKEAAQDIWLISFSHKVTMFLDLLCCSLVELVDSCIALYSDILALTFKEANSKIFLKSMHPTAFIFYAISQMVLFAENHLVPCSNNLMKILMALHLLINAICSAGNFPIPPISGEI